MEQTSTRIRDAIFPAISSSTFASGISSLTRRVISSREMSSNRSSLFRATSSMTSPPARKRICANTSPFWYGLLPDDTRVSGVRSRKPQAQTQWTWSTPVRSRFIVWPHFRQWTTVRFTRSLPPPYVSLAERHLPDLPALPERRETAAVQGPRHAAGVPQLESDPPLRLDADLVAGVQRDVDRVPVVEAVHQPFLFARLQEQLKRPHEGPVPADRCHRGRGGLPGRGGGGDRRARCRDGIVGRQGDCRIVVRRPRRVVPRRHGFRSRRDNRRRRDNGRGRWRAARAPEGDPRQDEADEEHQAGGNGVGGPAGSPLFLPLQPLGAQRIGGFALFPLLHRPLVLHQDRARIFGQIFGVGADEARREDALGPAAEVPLLDPREVAAADPQLGGHLLQRLPHGLASRLPRSPRTACHLRFSPRRMARYPAACFRRSGSAETARTLLK